MLTNEQINTLSEKYLDTVYRVAVSYTKNPTDAEDVTQNVFLALIRSRPNFENDDHARFWLIRVAINESKKIFRSPWQKAVSFEAYAQNLAFENPSHSDLFYTVMGLPVKYRMPLYLFYYEEYSTEEIASILKIPKGTVCIRLKRGRDLLEKCITEDV